LNTYFFIPQSLQINEDTYSKEQFFSDINNRIRFKTPQISLEGIIDEKNTTSPMTRIFQRLQKIEYGKSTKSKKSKIHRDLRLSACIIRASMRDQYRYLRTNLGVLVKQHKLEEIISSYMDTILKLQERMKSLGDKFLLPQVPYKLQEAFQLASQYISLQIESWVTRIFKKFENQINTSTRNKIIQIIEKEQKYRKNLKSRLIIHSESDNESFSYFKGIMKKYVQGVLYLDRQKKDPQSPILQVAYSVAAGFAMFCSLFLGFVILENLEVNSFPFIIAAIVIYILKDRVKDNIKYFSDRAVGFLFPDNRIDIVDEVSGEMIGSIKETVNYVDWDDLPVGILEIRRSSNRTSLEEKGKPEIVLSYNKKVELLNEKIETIHSRHRDISDILRFNIREFLRYADDPVRYRSHWNSETQELVTETVAKVYHLNIVLKLSSYRGGKRKSTYYKKFRVILDQNGIKRVMEPEIKLQ
jgi:hypothetical protein